MTQDELNRLNALEAERAKLVAEIQSAEAELSQKRKYDHNGVMWGIARYSEWRAALIASRTRKLAALRGLKAEIDALRQKRHAEAMGEAAPVVTYSPPGPRPATPAALAEMAHSLRAAQHETERLRLELQAAEARVTAGAARRREAIVTLNALLTCEDETLSDEAYDARLDAVFRRARMLVSAEKAAIVTERKAAQKEGA